MNESKRNKTTYCVLINVNLLIVQTILFCFVCFLFEFKTKYFVLIRLLIGRTTLDVYSFSLTKALMAGLKLIFVFINADVVLVNATVFINATVFT